jgi:hypothetical protein
LGLRQLIYTRAYPDATSRPFFLLRLATPFDTFAALRPESPPLLSAVHAPEGRILAIVVEADDCAHRAGLPLTVTISINCGSELPLSNGDSGPGNNLVGRSPWTARDALVPRATYTHFDGNTLRVELNIYR